MVDELGLTASNGFAGTIRPKLLRRVGQRVGPERATALPELKREQTDGGSVQIPLPRLFSERSPSATMLKGFSASIPQLRHLLPASRPVQKVAALARVFFGQRCN